MRLRTAEWKQIAWVQLVLGLESGVAGSDLVAVSTAGTWMRTLASVDAIRFLVHNI